MIELADKKYNYFYQKYPPKESGYMISLMVRAMTWLATFIVLMLTCFLVLTLVHASGVSNQVYFLMAPAVPLCLILATWLLGHICGALDNMPKEPKKEPEVGY